MQTRRECLCLEEKFCFGFTYLTLNQTKTDCFTYRKVLLRETQPDNGKLHFYWNHYNVSLIPPITVEKHHHDSLDP